MVVKRISYRKLFGCVKLVIIFFVIMWLLIRMVMLSIFKGRVVEIVRVRMVWWLWFYGVWCWVVGLFMFCFCCLGFV